MGNWFLIFVGFLWGGGGGEGSIAIKFVWRCVVGKLCMNLHCRSWGGSLLKVARVGGYFWYRGWWFRFVFWFDSLFSLRCGSGVFWWVVVVRTALRGGFLFVRLERLGWVIWSVSILGSKDI